MVGASVAVSRVPSRSIFDVYRDGVAHWWASAPLYGPGMRAFVYFPSAVLIFTPFAALGQPLDDLAWRVFSVALFILGLWRLVRLVRPDDTGVALAVVLLLLLPCSGVDVQRGQATAAMAGWIFLGAADLAERRFDRAALWLCLAVALKPLALVPLLLFGAVSPPLRGRLALGLALVFAAPFLRADPGYVAAQQAAMADTLTHAADLGVTRFNDVGMMLDRFGLDLPSPALLALRGVAALATLGLALLAARRLPPHRGTVVVLALAMAYLMLCNPRTELGNYMGMAAVIGLFMVTAPPRPWLGAIILGMGTQAYGNWIFRATDVWLKPALCLAFALWLAAGIVRASPTRGISGPGGDTRYRTTRRQPGTSAPRAPSR